MRILSGDETGLIKLVDVEENKVKSTFGEQVKDSIVQGILKLNEDYIVGAYSNGIVKLFNSSDGSTAFETPLGEAQNIIGLDFSGENNNIIVSQSNGNVSLLELGWNEESPYLDDPYISCPFLKTTNLHRSILVYSKITSAPQRARVNRFETSNLMVLSKDANPLVLDIENKKIIWKGKNVPNDYLDLQVPIHDLDCAFKDKSSVYVSTAYRKVRLYDLRQTNTRPTVDHLMKDEKFPLNHIVMSSCNNYVYVTDSAGAVFVLDTRKGLELCGKMKGATGSIRDISASNKFPYAITVSLDRFLRIYNTNTYKIVRRIFLGQKLSAVCFYDDELDDGRLEESLPEQGFKTQNEISKRAKETRTQLKKSKLKLTFEKKSDEFGNEDDDAE